MYKQVSSIVGHPKIIEYGKKTIDLSKAAQELINNRIGFPVELFKRLSSHFGICHPNQRILDLSTGRGTIARSLALRGCKVTAIDTSNEILEQSKLDDERHGLTHTITYKKGHPEDSGLESNQFDVVTAGQSWEQFDSAKTLKEVERLLKDNGKLVICHYDWALIPGSVGEATINLIKKYNPNFNMDIGTGYPKWAIDCQIAKFHRIENFSFTSNALYSHNSWLGLVRQNAGIKTILDERKIAQFDEELAQFLKTKYPSEYLEVPHRLFAVVATRPVNITKTDLDKKFNVILRVIQAL